MEPRLLTIFLVALSFPPFVHSLVRHYQFTVVMKNTTKLCSTKSIATINGQFPGPTLYAKEDDTVIIRVTNHIKHNVTIHWHGIKQLRTAWSDGPAYITQCPIQTGQSYVYNFTITGQRGTLLWHAHISWLRATLYGAIVIWPKRTIPHPFPKPHKEKIIILGEWWKSDVEAMLNQATNSGMAPNISDAHTINGQPGPVPGCTSQGYTLHVESGKTYLLRLINAALNDELFFKIAGHKLTVVEADASYIKPFETDTIFLSPGQTTNVLLTANQLIGKILNSSYFPRCQTKSPKPDFSGATAGDSAGDRVGFYWCFGSRNMLPEVIFPLPNPLPEPTVPQIFNAHYLLMIDHARFCQAVNWFTNPFRADSIHQENNII